MMTRFLSTAALCGLLMGGAPAHAQTTPLSGLIGALSGLGKTLTPPVPASAASAVAPARDASDTGAIMQLLAGPTTPSGSTCQFLDHEIHATLDQFRMRQYAMAGARAHLDAQQLAGCSLAGQGPSLPEAKTMVGQLLAVSAIANHNIGLDSPETVLSAQQALSLLSLDAGRNADIIAQLKESNMIPVADARQSGAPVLVASARELALKYNANRFGFERQYAGKLLRASGTVQTIGGAGNRALVVLEGIHKANLDQQSWSDVVQCTVADGAALDDAARLAKGQTVTVQGLFDNRGLGGIALQDCRIVH